jgi:hypothetical protein
LNSRKDAEDLQPGQAFSGGAHAPFWPGVRHLPVHLSNEVLTWRRRRVSPIGGLFSRTTSPTVSWSRR